jgi:hypothetical protein
VAFRNPLTSLSFDAITGLVSASQIDSVNASAIVGFIEGSQLAAESIDGKTITGALIRTAPAPDARWEMSGSAVVANRIQGFTGLSDESYPALLSVMGQPEMTVDGHTLKNLMVLFESPAYADSPTAALSLTCSVVDGAVATSEVGLLADKVTCAGPITAPNLGITDNATGPAAITDCIGVTSLLTAEVDVVAGRTYKVTAFGHGSHISTGASSDGFKIVDDQGGQRWMAYAYPVSSGATLLGTGVHYMTASSTRTATFTIQGTANFGALRVAANACQLTVEAC